MSMEVAGLVALVVLLVVTLFVLRWMVTKIVSKTVSVSRATLTALATGGVSLLVSDARTHDEIAAAKASGSPTPRLLDALATCGVSILAGGPSHKRDAKTTASEGEL